MRWTNRLTRMISVFVVTLRQMKAEARVLDTYLPRAGPLLTRADHRLNELQQTREADERRYRDLRIPFDGAIFHRLKVRYRPTRCTLVLLPLHATVVLPLYYRWNIPRAL
eukprot:1294392-Pyramimonas_sp.AAC.3